MSKNNRLTASDILKVVPITRKTLWLWQKNYKFFPDPVKEAHPGGRGIAGGHRAVPVSRSRVQSPDRGGVRG